MLLTEISLKLKINYTFYLYKLFEKKFSVVN